MEDTKKRIRKNYYVSNPEKYKQKSKDYYNEGGGKELKQQYYEANRQLLIDRAKARYQLHREEILEKNRLKLIEKKQNNNI